jgi:hypothetical protein
MSGEDKVHFIDESEGKKKNDAGKTYFTMTKVVRQSSDDRLHMVILSKCSYGVKLSNPMIKTFLPAAMREWACKLSKYIKDNS